jgi:hypothetical protein
VNLKDRVLVDGRTCWKFYLEIPVGVVHEKFSLDGNGSLDEEILREISDNFFEEGKMFIFVMCVEQ